MIKKVDTSDNKVFNAVFPNSEENQAFKTSFHQIDNSGGDIYVDEIIIFDGGDVYGYETNNPYDI